MGPALARQVAHLPHSKIGPRHLQRRALVYIRQSTPQQLIRHTESTKLQYALTDRAHHLGWARDRIEVIDEDLGRSGASAMGRPGFQRLVAEVGLEQIGVILAIEVSRFARSCLDWYQLLEVCALFGTLIADSDGVYDPADYNDRLLLGLRGTMSEAELHLIKRRMHDGRLAKARRGELAMALPIGYRRRPSGEVVKEPDEQARTVVETVFEQFVARGTVTGVLRYLIEHGVQLPVRERSGPRKGELSWRRPSRMTLHCMLENPIYGGAYVWGRRPTDARRKQPGRPGTGRTVAALGDWQVFLPDRMPAYISWEQYLANRRQLQANRVQAKGTPRKGSALLSGLISCGRCGLRMSTQYGSGWARYSCGQAIAHYGEPLCQSLAGRVLDAEVERLVLQALEPASLEISLEVAAQVETERTRHRKTWQQRLERAQYEAARALRQYDAVEPENRLVARTLEQQLEQKLAAQQQLQEEYARHLAEEPSVLAEQERATIRALAADIPGLWHAETTTIIDRKQIVRQLVDRIEVTVLGKTERVQVRVLWAGGHETSTETVRPVGRLDQLSYIDDLIARILALREDGLPSRLIAEQLNTEGWRPAKRRTTFSAEMVRALLSRRGLTRRKLPRPKERPIAGLAANEWTLAALAAELSMPHVTLYSWVQKGRLQARKTDEAQARWVICADAAELERLRELRRAPRSRWARQDEPAPVVGP